MVENKKKDDNFGCVVIPLITVGFFALMIALTSLFKSKSGAIDTLYGIEDEEGLVSQFQSWVVILVIGIGVYLFSNKNKED